MIELIGQGITVNVNSVRILRDVSFTLNSGSIVALIGPNGAGKTSLLNVISGKVAPTKGNVRLDGKLLTHQPRNHLAGMGLFRSFQEGRLFESLTAEENIAAAVQPPPDESLLTALLSRSRSQEYPALIGKALGAVDMEADRSVPASRMSYGMRKRTVMGQAIAASATVCLLDEPLAGVDAATREKMLAAIISLRDPRRILLVVEHDLEAINAIADRVLLMDRGQIVVDGSAREVLPSPAVFDAYLQAHGY
jgi:ABC-type branched-subunit amino acid transport system ATPase component